MLSMNIVPIVFSFNHYVLIPAGVCINSLLRNAKKDTFYDIFIMHGEGDLLETHKVELNRLKSVYTNFEINYINIQHEFDSVYTARGVPKVTYYRILIPDYIHKYEKVIFSDVDIIFKGDLSEIYQNTTLDGYYLAAVKSSGLKIKYVKSLGCNPQTYTSGGFQIYNLPELRKDNIKEKQLALCSNKYFYLDQDITNIVCKDKIRFISPKFNSTQTFYHIAIQNRKNVESIYSNTEVSEGLNPIVIHYNGVNPWQGLCQRHDTWWDEFNKSIFFDIEYYFSHYYKILNPSCKELINKMPKALFKNNIGKVYRKFFQW